MHIATTLYVFILLLSGSVFRLDHPMVSMSFLNDVGDINTPSLQYVWESLVNLSESLDLISALGI